MNIAYCILKTLILTSNSSLLPTNKVKIKLINNPSFLSEIDSLFKKKYIKTWLQFENSNAGEN